MTAEPCPRGMRGHLEAGEAVCPACLSDLERERSTTGRGVHDHLEAGEAVCPACLRALERERRGVDNPSGRRAARAARTAAARRNRAYRAGR